MKSFKPGDRVVLIDPQYPDYHLRPATVCRKPEERINYYSGVCSYFLPVKFDGYDYVTLENCHSGWKVDDFEDIRNYPLIAALS